MAVGDFARERVWDFWGRGGWELWVGESSEGMGEFFACFGVEFSVCRQKKFGVVDSRVCWVFGDLVRRFCGEVVVKCVANVVEMQSLLWTLNVGQGFQLYFLGRGSCAYFIETAGWRCVGL